MDGVQLGMLNGIWYDKFALVSSMISASIRSEMRSEISSSIQKMHNHTMHINISASELQIYIWKIRYHSCNELTWFSIKMMTISRQIEEKRFLMMRFWWMIGKWEMCECAQMMNVIELTVVWIRLFIIPLTTRINGKPIKYQARYFSVFLPSWITPSTITMLNAIIRHICHITPFDG